MWEIKINDPSHPMTFHRRDCGVEGFARLASLLPLASARQFFVSWDLRICQQSRAQYIFSLEHDPQAY